jgi:hypothetical protein
MTNPFSREGEAALITEVAAGSVPASPPILFRLARGPCRWGVAPMCPPAARFVTGVVLPVAGGTSIGF